MRSFVEAAADLVVSYGGSLSGEHGDGQFRGEMLIKMFGPRVVSLFEEVKRIFDPDDRMNPGKIVYPSPLDGQLWLGTDYHHAEAQGLLLLSQRRAQVLHRCPALRRYRQLPATPPRHRPTLHGPGPLGPVLVWPDTFSNSFHPSVAKSAVEVLEAAGFQVRLPRRPVCCGLTWISTGQRDTARRVLTRTVRILRDEIRAGTPVIGLEPSCTAVFRSDGPELLDGDEDLRRLSKQTERLPR